MLPLCNLKTLKMSTFVFFEKLKKSQNILQFSFLFKLGWGLTSMVSECGFALIIKHFYALSKTLRPNFIKIK